jgi:NAD(P)H-dependent flavin oxidoreductase YrpB (nitropropane dioxygenase family)
MRAEALRAGDAERMQAWAGQSSRLGRTEPANQLTARIWSEALTLLKQDR